MKEISLTKGFVALVDDDDYQRVMKLKWYALQKRSRGIYAARSRGPTIYMHHFILGIVPYQDKKDVDHINRNTLDNRKINLRLITRRQNILNSEKSDNAKLIERHGKKFRVRARSHFNIENLGSFSTKEEAAAVVDEYKKKGKLNE